MSGGLEERQATPGMLLVPLLRHQRMALAWMARRETGSSAPWGGILADDQVCLLLSCCQPCRRNDISIFRLSLFCLV